MNTSTPLIAALTPPPALVPQEGMTSTSTPITQGLPHAIPLGPRLRALLALPTGLAKIWRDLPAAAVLCSAGAEQVPPDSTKAGSGEPDMLARPVPRLRIQRDGATFAVLPLTGLSSFYAVETSAGAGAARLEIQVLDWTIHAGTVAGEGDFGSSITLAWRIADRAADTFAPLPPSEAVWKLLPKEEKMESPPGKWRRRILIEARYNRLAALRARIR